VEVLGVLDRSSGLIRLRATEPLVGASQAERFTKIFEPLPVWIHRGSKIITVKNSIQSVTDDMIFKYFRRKFLRKYWRF
jgi:hypothetical protein